MWQFWLTNFGKNFGSTNGTSILELQILAKVCIFKVSDLRLSSGVLFCPGYISQAANLGCEGMPVCRLFCLEELMEATNNFDKSYIMGESSYGKVISKNKHALELYIIITTIMKKVSFHCLIFVSHSIPNESKSINHQCVRLLQATS